MLHGLPASACSMSWTAVTPAAATNIVLLAWNLKHALTTVLACYHADPDASLIESQDDLGAGPVPPQSYDQQSYEPSGGKPRALETMAAQPSTDALFPSAGAGGSDDGGGDLAGGYNALEFKHLNVSDEIRELFKYIGRYQPHTIDLDTKLKPFIPDYIPCVGGIDEFIKVPRPDGKPDFLGLKVRGLPLAMLGEQQVLVAGLTS